MCWDLRWAVVMPENLFFYVTVIRILDANLVAFLLSIKKQLRYLYELMSVSFLPISLYLYYFIIIAI